MFGPKVNLPTERSVRITTGLIMFCYAASHFLGHATGVLLLDHMDEIGRKIFLAPWRTWAGRYILLSCFVVHGILGLKALYRRRHLRMPAIEAWQLGLGLLIPLLLIPHVSDVRLGKSLYNFDDSYFRIVYVYWLVQPFTGLIRQFLLLLTVWIHGCIGIHMWLRYRPNYARWRFWLLGIALAIPILAVLGINNAGWDAANRAEQPDFRMTFGPPQPGTVAAAHAADLALLWQSLQIAYVALVAAVFAARWLRDAHDRARRSVRISYCNGPVASVPRGFSVLEASRWVRLPHVSVCGGRGRCSTCRIRILQGLESLPCASAVELTTLERIAAPANVRLACQLRPDFDICVSPVLRGDNAGRSTGIDLRESRELTATALFVDLRESTRLAADRLPFDTVFIVDRYIQAVSDAVRMHHGYVTSVAGDGVMSVFGLAGDPREGARDALNATLAIWSAIDKLSADFIDEIGAPLRFGAGLHTGISIIGRLDHMSRPDAVHFLGDTGNVASRLESLTKEKDCTIIASEATVTAAEFTSPPWARATLAIRGRDDVLAAYLIRSDEEFAQGLEEPLTQKLAG